MKSLFATILAIGATTSALPAIAKSISESTTVSGSSTNYISATPAEPKAGFKDFNQFSNSFTQRSLNIAKQIPTDVIGLVIVDIDQLSWQALEQFQLPAQSPLLALDRFLAFLGQSSQLSITKDLQPWLGKEIAIALLGNPDNKGELSFAALSIASNDKQFDLFIEKLKGLNVSKPTETLYQDVKILEWQLENQVGEDKPQISKKSNASRVSSFLSRIKQAKTPNVNEQKPDSKPESKEPESEENEQIEPRSTDFNFKRFAIAKLPSGLAIIASDRQAIQKMIDLSVSGSQKDLPSLADNQLFLRSLNNPLWNRSLIAGYGDLKGIIGQFTEVLAADLPEISEIPGFSRGEYIQSLRYTIEQYSSFDLFAWITPKGVRSQSNSYFSEIRSPQPKDIQTRDRLLSYLPANVYGAITSRNFNRQWQWFVEQSKLEPTYKIFVEGLRIISPMVLGTESGIDIEKDIISWMDGEYAFVAFPSDRSPLKDIGINMTMGMLIRTSQPEAANAALDKLTKYFTKVGKNIVQVKKRQVGVTLLTSFEFPDFKERGKTQSVFAYGWRDRQTLMLTFGSDTASAFIPTPNPSLAESEMFREAIADMPQPNFGYFYLNANAIAKRASELLLSKVIPALSDLENSPSNLISNPELPKIIQTAVNKLGGSVFVYSETTDRFQSDFFLGLKP